MKTRPRSPFKHRRPASARLESVDSVAFRKAMYDEIAAEARRAHVRGEECHRLIRSAGIDPQSLDGVALEAISRLVGVIDSEAERILIISPTREWDDHSEFDQAICAAGLKVFIRPTMPSDHPGHGVPLDPAVPIPAIDLGDVIVVRELKKGLRVRQPITIRCEDGEAVA